MLCIGLHRVAWLALYVGKQTAEWLMLYENVYIHAHEVLYIQAELLADEMMSYKHKAKHIKSAETQMSGICLLWLV